MIKKKVKLGSDVIPPGFKPSDIGLKNSPSIKPAKNKVNPIKNQPKIRPVKKVPKYKNIAKAANKIFK